MLRLIRTNSDHPDFINLVKDLDAYLKIVDGDDHEFYNQFNNIDVLKHTVIAYVDNQPVGCGAFKAFNNSSVEIKRMYTSPIARNKGIASAILKDLEDWAKELNIKSTLLETGLKQTEAVKFYKKNNYKIIPNFGQYAGVENSVCFLKELK
ncbi:MULTISPECIES: GNAT family N-acetyltransferase [Mesoflavibacter]|uniref:GNAT family N-acetyltransferase n=1 Tax=Mesoflavibacter profundi TaxID=2708110 RepID=A0ABT4RW07_9FLAO|nr:MULTISPECIES: GNAT family N-acetyltransferase [Mesoflavibacter]MDA0176017.1 GNAT family N-acetyltransferase [Mesoflavibacter profundi]QIJ89647.1 putative acetyltransferase [Mesoflavibacter sp. HG96]QIJ92375.1 putative acetyltransferase [Mesoflavibacter sp. HG37]